MRSDLQDIEVIFQHQTPQAVCVREVEDGKDIWFPLAMVEIYPASGGELRRGCVATLTGPEKILTEKGLL